MPKSKIQKTRDGQSIHIMYERTTESITEVMKKNRHIDDERTYFSPTLSDLHDPFLLPDMDQAVDRIQRAREKKERIVVFGDYDVDGVSSTALLVRFLSEIGCEVSYRLPHRIHDGYGIKAYHFDELATKDVKLVITVDCGTRDIEPIAHAKTLGIDVIVTDHHAVPEIIPDGIIALINPKRKDSEYPFPHLAGAGVAFKLLHALAIQEDRNTYTMESSQNNTSLSSVSVSVSHILQRYVDFASLGTVADCMSLIGENRVITTLGLRQIKNSESAGLRRFVEGRDDIEGNGDLIGFEIGPRINASGRIETPLTALRWLLASEEKCDEFLSEIEDLNTKRKEVVKIYTEKALSSIDTSLPILFFTDTGLEHGIIGLIAGKLTETYGKPSIVLCSGHDEKRGELVASCRSPEWCNLIEILDACKEYFVRYGGHRQAAGFSIGSDRYRDFQETICQKMTEIYGSTEHFPKKKLSLESTILPSDITVETIEAIERFRPFGIGNPRPLWLLEGVTVSESSIIGKEQNHMKFSLMELPGVSCLLWNFEKHDMTSLEPGDILSLVVSLEKNEWNGKTRVQLIIRNIVADSEEGEKQEGR